MTPERAAELFDAGMRAQPEMHGGSEMLLLVDPGDDESDELVAEFPVQWLDQRDLRYDANGEFQSPAGFWGDVKLALACIKDVSRAFILAQAEMTVSITFGTDGWNMTMTTQTTGQKVWHLLEGVWDCLQV